MKFVSAGFDAHAEDPVGSLGLEVEDFAATYRSLPIARTEFAHDVMDVVFDRLLRDVQLAGDLFVGETLAQQRHQLLFPATEPEFCGPGDGRHSAWISFFFAKTRRSASRKRRFSARTKTSTLARELEVRCGLGLTPNSLAATINYAVASFIVAFIPRFWQHDSRESQDRRTPLPGTLGL